MTIEQAKQLARKMLSAKRYRHTKNVAAAARQLALHWGANPAQAELAGWLHDIVKEQSHEALLQLAGQDDIISKSIAGRPVPVWHGPCATVFLRGQGIADAELLDAISCHTTGRANMSLLDKILFIADATSAERTFPGVDEIRTLARTNLDAAVIASMEENLAYLKRKGKKLDRETLQALQYLQSRRE